MKSYIQNLKLFFILIIVCSTMLLIYIQYANYQFKNNDLSNEIMNEIHQKEKEILRKVKYKYGINAKVPIIISNTLGNRLYGLAVLDKANKIKIYLNKKMFQESKKYMINNVLAHEYAHAIMFMFGRISNHKSGHTKEWVNVCNNIGGQKCEQYVNTNDIVMDKLKLFN